MIRTKIENLIRKFVSKETSFSVVYPSRKEYGDYSVFLPLKEAKIVQEKIERERPHFLEKTEIVPPGFLNFYLKKDFLIKTLKKILKEKERFGSQRSKNTVLIDYSSPNIAKSFGIGHLRSTIIGQALYNIYKFLGWRCIGINHLGDWGTQFGKLIYQIKRKKISLKSLTIDKMEKLYVQFHKEAKENPEIEEKARWWFKKLEQGDKEAKKIWRVCKKASLKEFDRIYRLLGVKFDYILGESFYKDKTKEVVEELKKKKIVHQSQGALIVEFPDKQLPPAMILKSDGSTTYFVRDLAAIKYRLKRWNPDLFIYEVGADQTLYFKQLFRVVELLKWKGKKRFVHIAHGLIRSKEGKFSTREGKTIHLEEVLEEAIRRARKIIEKSETSKNLSEREKIKICKVVGIGGIKYQDLSSYHTKDIIFDWNKILTLKGNSGPYLQYTYARSRSVLKKAKTIRKNFKTLSLCNFEIKPEEMEILRTIYKFPEVVEDAGYNFSPNLICEFAFKLAQRYNLFYELYPIIEAENSKIRDFRLALSAAVSQILKNSLSLLGIEVLEKM
ncbi:arginine--tRNA ligase [bacterium]|nr:arginine--tRNA ligase [bacterium]